MDSVLWVGPRVVLEQLADKLHSSVSRHTTEEERVSLVAQAILSTRLSQDDNDKLQNMPGTDFEEDTFISEFRIRRELEKETELTARLVDCCANGCMAFTGKYADRDRCVLCNRPQWKDVGAKNMMHYTCPLTMDCHRCSAKRGQYNRSPTFPRFIVFVLCGGTRSCRTIWDIEKGGHYVRRACPGEERRFCRSDPTSKTIPTSHSAWAPTASLCSIVVRSTVGPLF
jgi:hypothetical protein